MLRPLARVLFLATAALPVQGCFSASYVAQAARGELGILASARPIRKVVRDDTVPARTRRLLAAVHSVKAFAQAQGLKPTASYRCYSDLHRRAAVWVVEACAPLSFDVKRWSFPIVGSIPYLGFFDEERARAYARSLEETGRLDVDVRTATAYSTLGWFHDPVLSTMIRSGDDALGELANVVVHESVHATVYVRDQSTFDESLASFVADRLTPLWLDSVLGPAAPETKAWLAAHRRERTFFRRLHRAYVELDGVYRSDWSDARKRATKAEVLAAVREELHYPGTLNNAVLADTRTYDAGRAAFERLLESCGGSWPAFLQAIRQLTPADFAHPQQDDLDGVIDGLARSCLAAEPRHAAQPRSGTRSCQGVACSYAYPTRSTTSSRNALP